MGTNEFGISKTDTNSLFNTGCARVELFKAGYTTP